MRKYDIFACRFIIPDGDASLLFEKKFIPKWQLVSSHAARRTFITLSLVKGMLPNHIMKITGHKSLKSFEKYIRIVEHQAFDEAIEIWENKNIFLSV